MSHTHLTTSAYMNTPSTSSRRRTLKRTLTLLPMMMCLQVSQAFAAGTGTSNLTSGADNVLQGIIDALTGNTARLVAIIALVFFGFMYMTSEDNSAWKKAGKYIIGLVMIFGAVNIVDELISGFAGAML